jgi:hypothetical protein
MEGFEFSCQGENVFRQMENRRAYLSVIALIPQSTNHCHESEAKQARDAIRVPNARTFFSLPGAIVERLFFAELNSVQSSIKKEQGCDLHFLFGLGVG